QERESSQPRARARSQPHIASKGQQTPPLDTRLKMVGFLRKKKSDKTLLTGETALDRKGKVDGASLLDGDGEPTEGTLYDMNGRRYGRKN
ncbi:hypothetical protein BBJ28_00021018, partial [Nothophytophthora sp. Chile5]